MDDRDLAWINNKIKSLMKNRTEYFKNYVKSNNPDSNRTNAGCSSKKYLNF